MLTRARVNSLWSKSITASGSARQLGQDGYEQQGHGTSAGWIWENYHTAHPGERKRPGNLKIITRNYWFF